LLDVSDADFDNQDRVKDIVGAVTPFRANVVVVILVLGAGGPGHIATQAKGSSAIPAVHPTVLAVELDAKIVVVEALVLGAGDPAVAVVGHF